MKMQRAARVLILLAPAVLLLQLLPSLSQGQTASEEGLAIIVNQSNPVDNLSSAELRKIFLGEKSHWTNGRRITLVMMDAGPERKTVLRDIYHMNETDLNNHFIHGLFTGEVLVSPKSLSSAIEVRKFVFNVPGAIGYVRAADADSSVKVVRIDGRLPDDKDYKFRVQRSGR